MREFVVVGPINGMYHIAYRVIGTHTYSSIAEFSTRKAAYEELDRLMGEPEDEQKE